MKVVVFGGGGQLGRELCRAVWPAGVQVVAHSRGEADVADANSVRRALDTPELGFVINASAYNAVDKAEEDREGAFRANELGPNNLAAACASARVPLIHVSTDYVFDGSQTRPYREDDPVRPLGAYGESKAAGEAAVRALLEQHVIIRTSWVFSAHATNFVKTMIRLAQERDRLRVVADQFGRPTPARDLARALVRVIEKLMSQGRVEWGTYHYAGAGRASWHELAAATIELQATHTGRRPAVEAITTADYPTPARRPASSELDTSKFERVFEHVIPPWRAGLEDVVQELFRGETPA